MEKNSDKTESGIFDSLDNFWAQPASRAQFLKKSALYAAGSAIGLGLLNSLTGCATTSAGAGGAVTTIGPEDHIAKGPKYPNITFMVLSDTHLYDDSLGISGSAWVDYMANDRKLLKDSEESLSLVIEQIKAKKPTFLLISGDLTKDGERQCHEKLIGHLNELKALGIPAYVVPGNHDIHNTDAARYFPTGGKESIPNIGPEDFAQLYNDFGYGQAISRDPASLSYLVEPVPGLWILGIDSAKYEDNLKLKTPVTSGRVRPQTMKWLESMLSEAEKQGKAVIAMEHHPLLEHFDGMKDKYGEYVVDDNWTLASLLASHNVSLMFTGHFHASSIVQHRWFEDAPEKLRNKTIVDVETGSLVTWPCTYRTVTLGGDGTVRIATDRVSQLPSYAALGRSFDVDGKATIEDGLRNIAVSTMKNLGVPDTDRNVLSGQIIDAMMAHYAGDAHFSGSEMLRKQGLSLMGQLVVASYDHFIQGLWKARSPARVELMEDNNLVIIPDSTLLAFLEEIRKRQVWA